ncbi:DUF2798 domain-containing protein [Devosia sp.]|uniref:DUF2798 domain-containing protein n=1 Tax=Devosia sp. TaxID=1871048 RepID=UPI003BAA2862
MTFKKLPARYAAVVTPFLLSLLMTCVVSAVSLLRSRGLDATALALWPSAWAISWVVAFPVLLVVLPLVRRMTGMIVDV